ncbi:MAG TPA: SPFH domain-containing protein [Thermoanaerobaculia bacterium]|nr:SPFH domain-containing protein [Thermoanaerobaculia bacterium]
MIVPADHAYVVERLGRYHRTLRAGMHFLVPLIDRVAFRHSLLPVRTELTDRCITLDNVPVDVTTRVQWQIADPERASYASANVQDFITGIVKTKQREAIAQKKWDDARETTRELQQSVLRATAEAVAGVGAKLLAVEIRVARHAPSGAAGFSPPRENPEG